MTRIVPLDAGTSVAGQIDLADLTDLAAARITMVINNRPDGEEPGQPGSAQMQAAAAAAGLAYRHIPVSGGISSDQVAAMADALDAAEGRVLAYCRSGTRSTYLWALARKLRGADGAGLIARAAAAGYDLNPLRPYLEG
ncbi:MAG: TIGR01244 family sulfur transferase [Allosphingosinicella sp.]